MRTDKTWVVAFRNKETHEVVGPVWFHKAKHKPTRWAREDCYAGCEYAIMPGRGYDEDHGVPDSVLQRQEWHAVEEQASWTDPDWTDWYAARERN